MTYPPAAPAAPPIIAPSARLFFATPAPTAAPVAPPTTAPCCEAVPGALLHPENVNPAQIVPIKSISFFIAFSMRRTSRPSRPPAMRRAPRNQAEQYREGHQGSAERSCPMRRFFLGWAYGQSADRR